MINHEILIFSYRGEERRVERDKSSRSIDNEILMPHNEWLGPLLIWRNRGAVFTVFNKSWRLPFRQLCWTFETHLVHPAPFASQILQTVSAIVIAQGRRRSRNRGERSKREFTMNVFRLAGDMTHLLSIIVLLLKIRTTKSCSGIIRNYP